jgi:hypothetical protein
LAKITLLINIFQTLVKGAGFFPSLMLLSNKRRKEISTIRRQLNVRFFKSELSVDESTSRLFRSLADGKDEP